MRAYDQTLSNWIKQFNLAFIGKKKKILFPNKWGIEKLEKKVCKFIAYEWDLRHLDY